MTEKKSKRLFARGPLVGLEDHIDITEEVKAGWVLELYKISEFFGGVTPFCDALGVTRQTFYDWKNFGVSAKNAVYLESFVNKRAGKRFTTREALSPWFLLTLCEDTTTAAEDK